MSGSNPNDDKTSDDDTPIKLAGLNVKTSDGSVKPVFRAGPGSPAPPGPAAPSSSPANTPTPAATPSSVGRSLGTAPGSESLDADALRERRIAMLAGAPGAVPAPAMPAPSTPAKNTKPYDSTPLRTPAPAATPGRSPAALTPAKLLQSTLNKEPNCGYLLRYILQVRRTPQDLHDDNIPSLLSAIFMGETEDYTTLNNDALWDAADALGLNQLTESMVEGAIDSHRYKGDDAFVITCYGRVKTCLADMFVKQSFTETCTVVKQALRTHYLSSFIPAVMEDGAAKQKTLDSLLYHPDTQSATDMLEEVCVHLSDDLDTGCEIVEKLANSLLYENEKEVGQQGLPILSRFCSFLVRISKSPAGERVLGAILAKEAAAPLPQTPFCGLQFASQCWLRRFLMIPKHDEVRNLLKQVNNYPKTHPSETEPVLGRPREVTTNLLKDVSNMLRDALLKKGAAGRTTVLDWVRATLRAGDGRTAMSKNSIQIVRQRNMQDLFALNLAAISFTLSDPVCQKLGEKAVLSYVASTHAAKHFPSWSNATRMKKDHSAAPVDGPAFNFATEILFASIQALHTLVMPAVRLGRWAHEGYMRSMSHAMGQQGVEPRLVEVALEWDMLRMQLLAPSFVDAATALSVTICSVVQREMDAHGQQPGLPAAVEAMPAFMLEDALDWAVFVCNYAPHLVKGTEGMPQLLEFAIKACTHPTLLLNHPMLEGRVISLIAAMQDKQRQQSAFGSDAWAASQWSSHRSETSLFNIVERSPVCKLLPRVLFRVYSSASTEGFDMDKDDHLAHTKDLVLPLFVQLVVVAPFKEGLLQGLGQLGEGAAEGEDDFSRFVQKLVTESTHCLDDSLNRLTEVNDIAQLMADKVSWEGLPANQKQAKQAHFEAQGRSARGFMSSANKSLQVIQMLLNPTRADEPPPPPPAISSPPVLRSIAHLVRYFLLQIYGTRGENLLKLPQPQKYEYDRLGVVQVLCKVVSLLAADRSFHEVFALHDDYERWVLSATVEEVKKTQLGGLSLLNRLTGFCDALQAIAPQGSARPVSEMSEAAWNPPTGKMVETSQEAYTTAFEDIHFEQADLGGDDGFVGHYYKDEAAKAGALSGTSKTLPRAFKKEWKQFADLPLYPQASIFMRCDENRMDVMRMVITGPEEGPYAYGMFVFDVFLPAAYPNVPPLMTLQTTGGGTVRFNPNLYENGKVCLSLLGTWYGEGQETKWQPDVSSLFQVGASIQSMIFVPDPYFNEPGNERERGTAEGDKWSEEHNEGLRLSTLRHAVIDNIKSPPRGCEELSEAYFKKMAPVILATAHRWASESSPQRRPKFLKVLEQLHEVLGDGDETDVCKWVTAGRARLNKKRTAPAAEDDRRSQPSAPQQFDNSLGMALMAALHGSGGNVGASASSGAAQQEASDGGMTQEQLEEEEEIARAIQRSLDEN